MNSFSKKSLTNFVKGVTVVTYEKKVTKRKTVDLNIRGINEEIKRGFKSLCVDRDVSLKDAVENFMREELRKAGRLPGQKRK